MKYNHYCCLFFLSISLISPLFAAESRGNEIMPHDASMLFFYAEKNRWCDFEVHLRNIFLPQKNNGEDYADENGLTLLHLAVKANQKSSADLLLTMDASVKTHPLFEKNGKLLHVASPLHLAVELGHKEIVELIVAKYPESIHSTVCEYDATPLHVAAFFGQKEITKVLLNKGAKIDALNSEGSTPIHVAAFSLHAEVLKTMFEYAQPTQEIVMKKNNDKNTALSLVQRRKDTSYWNDQHAHTEKVIQDHLDSLNKLNFLNGAMAIAMGHVNAQRDKK